MQIVEVGPRDGLQNETAAIPTDVKIAFIDALSTTGVAEIELEFPFGTDFGERLTLNCPISNNRSATWWFDGLPHAVVTVQGLRRAPDGGHMTAERPFGDYVFSLFDRAPPHTVMALTPAK